MWAAPFFAVFASMRLMLLVLCGQVIMIYAIVFNDGGLAFPGWICFALAMLVRQDKCSVEDVQAALRTFDALDADGSGQLDVQDLVDGSVTDDRMRITSSSAVL